MAMPWTQARDFAAVCARIRREALIEAAIAARAAAADARDWRRWVEEMSRGA